MSNHFGWEPVAAIKGITNGLGHNAKLHRPIAGQLTLRCPVGLRPPFVTPPPQSLILIDAESHLVCRRAIKLEDDGNASLRLPKGRKPRYFDPWRNRPSHRKVEARQIASFTTHQANCGCRKHSSGTLHVPTAVTRQCRVTDPPSDVDDSRGPVDVIKI